MCPLINTIYILIFFLSAVIVSADNDSLKEVLDLTYARSGNPSQSIEKNESLAVELLLNDLEFPPKDSLRLLTNSQEKNRVQSIKPVLEKSHGVISTPLALDQSRAFNLKGVFNHQRIAMAKRYLKYFLLLNGFLVIVVITIIFANYRKDRNRFLTTGRLSIMDKEVQLACDFIEQNYANKNLSIEFICSELVTGEAFLRALFLKELGISLENFIQQVRVNRVKILLSKDATAEAAKIVECTGFINDKEFQKVFLEICGVEFEKYRQSITTLESASK